MLIKFLEKLKEELAGMTGVFDCRPIIIDSIAEIKESENLTIAQAWYYLNIIGNDLKYLPVDQASQLRLSYYRFYLPGIWIDDYDNGKTRFWIFPTNLCMAFCYTYNGHSLRLTPFEFAFYSDNENDDEDFCAFITAEGNEQIIIENSQCSNDQIVSADFNCDFAEDSIDEVSFKPITKNPGDWFNWTKFTRLDKTDERYKQFSSLISESYNENEMFQIIDVKCDYEWLINIKSALVAIDNDFLYLKEPNPNLKFYLSRVENDEFEYIPRSSQNGLSNLSKLSKQINEHSPLYMIRRNESQYESNSYQPQDITDKTNYEDFKEVVRNTRFEDQVSIYNVVRNNKSIRMICFNKYSRRFDFDTVIKHYGVKKCIGIKLDIES